MPQNVKNVPCEFPSVSAGQYTRVSFWSVARMEHICNIFPESHTVVGWVSVQQLCKNQKIKTYLAFVPTQSRGCEQWYRSWLLEPMASPSSYLLWLWKGLQLMLLMKMLKSTDPSTNAWGTPLVTALHLDTEQLTTTLWVPPVPHQLNSSPIKSISFQFGEKEVVGYCIKGHTEVLWCFFPCSLMQLHRTCYPMVHEPEWPQKQLLPERNLEGKRIGKKKKNNNNNQKNKDECLPGYVQSAVWII